MVTLVLRYAQVVKCYRHINCLFSLCKIPLTIQRLLNCVLMIISQ